MTTTTLTWGIKESLIAYIERLEDGVFETIAGASRTGNEFQFPLDAAASQFDTETQQGVLQFRGSVIITGHWGGMRVEINDPRITLAGDTGELSTLIKSVFGDNSYITFGTLNVTSPAPQLTAAVSLAPGGQSLMGQQYSVGQELSPLSISWS